LYLVRHAIAAERGDDWPDDTKRPLTQKGIARMRQVIRGLRALDVEVDVVLTSPLVRARQTADLLVAGLRPAPDAALLAPLAPGGTPTAVVKNMDTSGPAATFMLVGHEPGLGELGAWLTGAREPLAFKKGGVCRIDFPDGPAAAQGRLVWLATPAMLRAVGKD
jgi:phosphohistidine phosphatase